MEEEREHVAEFGEGSTFGGRGGARFRVEQKVGEGGQAKVYRCVDTKLRRVAALKLCTADGAARQSKLQRFEAELRLTSRVQHPHVLQVYDCGELDSGEPWVLLEWMEHGSLGDLVLRERQTGHYLPLPYVHYYATAMAAGLRAAHGAELIHRDVKPDNVLIAKDGVAKITDFGIAKDLADDAPQLTTVDTTVGTIGFMAPEQLAGLPGPQSDIFSWAVTVYTLLMGGMPAQNKVNGIPRGHVLLEAFEEVPGAFRPVLERALQPQLRDRYSSFTEVLDDLAVMDLTAPDLRPLFGTDNLPTLPSGAFVSGFTTSAAVPPVIRPDGSVPPQKPATFDGTLSPMPDSAEQFADTADLVVSQTEAVQAETIADTGTTRQYPGTSPPAPAPRVVAPTAAMGVPADRPQESLPDEVGPTRAAPVARTRKQRIESPSSGPNRMPMVAAAVGVVLVLIGLGVLLNRAPAPDLGAESAAALAYGEAVLRGDASAAATAAAALPASAADRVSGQVVAAWDALASAKYDDARAQSAALLAHGGAYAAAGSLITGASFRRQSPTGYRDALQHLRTAAECTECGALADHAARAVQQTCWVAGCDGMPAPSERDGHLAAASVLRGDGHLDAAAARVQQALAQPVVKPTCFESAVLAEFGSEVAGVPASQWALARTAAARDAAHCGQRGAAGK